MQEELLDKHKEADLRVYAVWFSMYGTERRENWPPDALTDRRVVHLWDEEKTVGRWYLRRIGSMEDARAAGSAGLAGDVLWDAYEAVYRASWKPRESHPNFLRAWARRAPARRPPTSRREPGTWAAP